MEEPTVREKYRKLLYETAEEKVLDILFKYPDKEFSLSDLARESGVAKANIGKILKKFERGEVINITKLSKIWRIKANQENQFFLDFKIIVNLASICESDLINILNEIYRNPRAIILFGSFRWGEDVYGSDIDIAIEVDEDTNYKILLLKDLIKTKKQSVIKEIDELEKDIGRYVQLHIFNRKKVDLHTFNNIANGIVLDGFLEVKP